jgi:asparagine synthetase B (glutamine-hydrolysing)
MCGIIGIYHPDHLMLVNEDVFGRMLSSLSHRGPDGEGIHRDENVILGHRRLSIIDLSTGAQPMSNEDGTIWVCTNGEVFNYRELMVDLSQQGHHFRTTCDIEVIPHLYEGATYTIMAVELDMTREAISGQYARAIKILRSMRVKRGKPNSIHTPTTVTSNPA